MSHTHTHTHTHTQLPEYTLKLSAFIPTKQKTNKTKQNATTKSSTLNQNPRLVPSITSFALAAKMSLLVYTNHCWLKSKHTTIHPCVTWCLSLMYKRNNNIGQGSIKIWKQWSTRPNRLPLSKSTAYTVVRFQAKPLSSKMKKTYRCSTNIPQVASLTSASGKEGD